MKGIVTAEGGGSIIILLFSFDDIILYYNITYVASTLFISSSNISNDDSVLLAVLLIDLNQFLIRNVVATKGFWDISLVQFVQFDVAFSRLHASHFINIFFIWLECENIYM